MLGHERAWLALRRHWFSLTLVAVAVALGLGLGLALQEPAARPPATVPAIPLKAPSEPEKTLETPMPSPLQAAWSPSVRGSGGGHASQQPELELRARGLADMTRGV